MENSDAMARYGQKKVYEVTTYTPNETGTSFDRKTEVVATKAEAKKRGNSFLNTNSSKSNTNTAGGRGIGGSSEAGTK